MLKTKSYIKLFLIFYIPAAAAVLTFGFFTWNTEILKAYIWGNFLGLLIALSSVFIVKNILNRSLNVLLAGMFGGMGLRFIMVIIISVYVLKKTGLDTLSFFGGFLGSLIILHILEILYLIGNFSTLKKNKT